jgi:hypothetical protein
MLEVPAMTGSALAPVVIPIVAFVFLFLWIGMVYHAAAHPAVHHVRDNRAPLSEHEAEAIARQAGADVENEREHRRPDQRAA